MIIIPPTVNGLIFQSNIAKKEISKTVVVWCLTTSY